LQEQVKQLRINNSWDGLVVGGCGVWAVLDFWVVVEVWAVVEVRVVVEVWAVAEESIGKKRR